MNHSDIAALMRGAAPVIRDYLATAVQPLIDKIAELERRLDAVPSPKDGKDADVDQVVALAAERILPEINELRSTIEAIPAPLQAPEIPDIHAMIKEAVENSESWMRKDFEELRATVAALPPAEKGKDADPAEVAALVTQEAERILAGWERPKDGKDGAPGEKGLDGAPGRDGKDGLDAMDVMIDREGDLVFTMSDGRMKNVGLVVGKDGNAGMNGRDGAPGLDGKSGVDGVGFDDLDLVETDQGVMLRFTRGEVVKDFRLPIITDRGVFRDGAEYLKGDGVSYGGSFWIAQEATAEKPDGGKGWRLAVKRGRDGKDGQMKPARDNKPVKVG
ncbi:hypothetical protein [Mesorhizobium sp.]|uniref:hypothetical protein n=1 Tax=Mesorhizobium sp. TaxID=1871066 RepID=UPI000FE60EB1|nr:hypothetical protein [Mesorhizobium sp.]RWN33435.1 MAG: hypothetical protein EOR95_15925 [Mesorhizobium sp.]